MSNTSLLGSFGGQAGDALMFRNVVINGNFDVWQRGTSGTNSGTNLGSYPSADRWRFLTHTAGVGWTDGTLTQNTDTPSSDIKYSVKVVSTSAALDDVVVFQTVEAVNAQSLAGKPATLSFWCKKGGGLASAKTFKYAVRYLNTADVGTNAPLTMDLTTLIQEATISSTSLSSSWTKITMSIPAMPSQAANGVIIEFRLDDDNLGSGDLLFLSQVQLEAGPTATPFERRPIGMELSLCERYYERGSMAGKIINGYNPTNVGFRIEFRVTKRGTNTVNTPAIPNLQPGGANVVAGTMTGNTDVTGCPFVVGCSGTSNYYALYVSNPVFWTADAEL